VRDKDFVYFVDFENEGGLITPLPLAITLADGSVERLEVPAEIWRRNKVKSRLDLFKWPNETRDLMKDMMVELKDAENETAVPLEAQ